MGKKTWMIVLLLFCMLVFGAGCFALGRALGGKESTVPAGNGIQQAENGLQQAENEKHAAFPQELLDSIVLLEIYDKSDKKVATASGFVAFEPKRLVTCRHALVNMDYAVCTTEKGETFRVTAITEADEASDLAFLNLPEDCSLKSLQLSKKQLKRGEGVTAVGSQFGILNVVTDGNVSMVKPSYILFTAPVNSGSSGGPLFDSSGGVCGVVRGAYDDGQGINVAVPIELLINLYEKNGGTL